MEHLKEAAAVMEQGNSQKALEIVNNLLDLAPRNQGALGLKARILESWGQFDDSIKALHTLSQLPNLDSPALDQIRDCANEERQVFFFTQSSGQGRFFYPIPTTQVLISSAGMVGCLVFLVLIPNMLQQSTWALIGSFLGLVVVPWVAFIIFSLTTIKRIHLHNDGLTVQRAFRSQNIPWSQCHAVIKYSNEIKKDLLMLELHTQQGDFNTGHRQQPHIRINLSKHGAHIWARRHFLRTVLAHAASSVYECEENRMAVPHPTVYTDHQTDKAA